MALETIMILDASGVQRKVTVDLHDTDSYAQVFKAAFAVDGSTPALVSSSNPMPVVTKHAGATGTQTSVASTVTANTTLLAADANRFGVTIYNESTSILFVLLGGGTESATVYTVQIGAGGYYEVPEAFVTLRASGHWVTANGSARITTAT